MHLWRTVLLCLRGACAACSAVRHRPPFQELSLLFFLCCFFWHQHGKLSPACVQRAERGLGVLYPSSWPCCLSRPSPREVPQRTPSWLRSEPGVRFTGSGTSRGVGRRYLAETLGFSLLRPQVSCPNRRCCRPAAWGQLEPLPAPVTICTGSCCKSGGFNKKSDSVSWHS